MARDLVIVSHHEKGFWQADLYLEGCGLSESDWRSISPTPDGFFTMKRGQTMMDAMHKAKEKWPQARIDLAAEVEPDDDAED